MLKTLAGTGAVILVVLDAKYLSSRSPSPGPPSPPPTPTHRIPARGADAFGRIRIPLSLFRNRYGRRYLP